jgi:hypothetical protein
MARRASRRNGAAESPGHEPAGTPAAPADDRPQIREEDVADDARVESVQNVLHAPGASERTGDAG